MIVERELAWSGADRFCWIIRYGHRREGRPSFRVSSYGRVSNWTREARHEAIDVLVARTGVRPINVRFRER